MSTTIPQNPALFPALISTKPLNDTTIAMPEKSQIKSLSIPQNMESLF
jgi:hypothetical protein